MPRRLSIPNTAIPAFVLIAEHGDKLPILSQVSASIPLASRTFGRVIKEFSDKAKLPLSDARKIVQQVAAFNLLGTNEGVSAAETFANLTESLIENHSGSKVNLDKWKAAKDSLIELLAPEHPIGLLQKTTKLKYDYQNILGNVGILTDVRPVFDNSAREIQLLNVAHTLQLEYSDGTERRTLYFAMDAIDIAKLKSQCARAETKAATLKEKLKVLLCPISGGDLEDD